MASILFSVSQSLRRRSAAKRMKFVFWIEGRKAIHTKMLCLGSPFGRAVTAGD